MPKDDIQTEKLIPPPLSLQDWSLSYMRRAKPRVTCIKYSRAQTFTHFPFLTNIREQWQERAGDNWWWLKNKGKGDGAESYNDVKGVSFSSFSFGLGSHLRT